MSHPRVDLSTALADRYRIERELGAGGMATVYLAEDLKHHRQVAIKVLRSELGQGEGPERFLQEIRVAAKLSHPHIVGLLDSGVIPAVDGQAPSPYYVMPYLAGESLRERLARIGRLPIAEAARLTSEVADALAKAHRAGVVHRDIKPENILIADGHAMVMDFGVAKALSDATGTTGLTSAGLSLGTPGYMAPEQVVADPRIDHRADLYALGLVAYEMLAGKSPYEAITPQQRMAAHVTQTPAPVATARPDTPAPFAALVMRLLAKDPDQRAQSGEDVVAALSTMQLSGSHQASSPASATRLRLLAGVAVLAISAIGWMVWRGRSPATTDADRSVGVMLFDNITNDTADAYLADGLASEIATSLGRVPRLEVRSPGAVRSAQKGGLTDPREVGRILSVSNVVEGEFQRVGDRIRIAARLVAVPSGTQRWSESWTRPASDLLQVQEEIARAVVNAIAGELQPAEQKMLAARITTSPEAYDHYLRGQFLFASRLPVTSIRAVREFESAVALDSSFVQAWSRIALTYGLFLSYGWDTPVISSDSMRALGNAAADRAMSLDSLSGDALLARSAMIDQDSHAELQQRIRVLRRATQLDPRNAEAWHQYATMMMFLGAYEESIALQRQALAIEPVRPISAANIAEAYTLLRQDSAGLAWYDTAIAQDPSFASAYSERVFVRLRLGDIAGARADAEAALRLGPMRDSYYGLSPLAAVEAAEGDTAEARRLMARAMAPFARRPITGTSPMLLLPGLVAAGQREEALRRIEAITPRGPTLWWSLQFPMMDPLRNDPRFQRVIEESKPPRSGS